MCHLSNCVREEAFNCILTSRCVDSRPRVDLDCHSRCAITVGVATVSTLYMLHRSIKYRIEVYNNMNVPYTVE